LLESELFGYEEGAFTGARRCGKKGKFELANGGTLFLDEIGDMPLLMQAKILRALQEGEIERVGGGKPIPVDVRIIAATNKDLIQEVSEKRFRADLYYRLNVLSIPLPPLRNRPEDVDIYIDAFLDELNERYHTEVLITPEARKELRAYPWPGNVRELKNIIERCYATQEDDVIVSISLPREIKNVSPSWAGHNDQRLETIMDGLEREVLLAAIQKNQWNLKKTSESLGIHRVTLYKKMDKHGIKREPS
jgi:transcriptional regulator with PAS, ATPase and Fis domain